MGRSRNVVLRSKTQFLFDISDESQFVGTSSCQVTEISEETYEERTTISAISAVGDRSSSKTMSSSTSEKRADDVQSIADLTPIKL